MECKRTVCILSVIFGYLLEFPLGSDGVVGLKSWGMFVFSGIYSSVFEVAGYE